MWKTHFKQVLAACGLIVVFLFVPAAGRSTEEQTWSIYANVEDGGKLVTGLDRGHFRVWLDNRSQEFELEPAETPMSVVLLVEYAQSSWQYLSDIQNAIGGFLDYAPEGNWYALVTFDRDTNIAVDFTKQKGQIASAFSALREPLWNETNTLDAIYNTLDMTAPLSGRRAIVFIGSGLDSFSKRTLADVEKALEASDVTVYSLAAASGFRSNYEPSFGTSSRMGFEQSRALLNMMANKTGGEAWFPNFDMAFRDAMKGVMQDMSTQYKIVVKGQVPGDGGSHKIKVEAFTVTGDKRKDFKVRVREGIRRPLS